MSRASSIPSEGDAKRVPDSGLVRASGSVQPAQPQPQPQPRMSALRGRHNWLINLLCVQHHYEGCLSLAEAALKEAHGASPFALYIKALVKRQQGKIDESLAILQEAIKLDPRDPFLLKSLGRSLFLLGRPLLALEILEEAKKKRTRKSNDTGRAEAAEEDWELWFLEGLCLVQLGGNDQSRLQDAVESLEMAKATQRNECVFLHLARLLIRLGRLEDAEDVFEEGGEAFPDSPKLLRARGLLALRQGDSETAFDFLGRSLALDPSDPDTIQAAASIIQDHGDSEVALFKYRAAVYRRPECFALWSNVGACFLGTQKRRLLAAGACLERAWSLGPLQWIPLFNLGLSFLHRGQDASAFVALSACLRLQPDVVAALGCLGIAFYRLGELKSAIAAFQQSLEICDDPFVLVNFAFVLLQVGRQLEAADLLRKLRADGSVISEAKGLQVNSETGDFSDCGDGLSASSSEALEFKGEAPPPEIDEDLPRSIVTAARTLWEYLERERTKPTLPSQPK